MTCLTNLGVTGILCSSSFSGRKSTKRDTWLITIRVLGKVVNNFVLSNTEDNTLGPLNRTGIADLSLWRTLLAISQKSYVKSQVISCSMWDKPGWLNCFGQFSCDRLSSFNWKGFYNSYVWSSSLCEGFLFAQELPLGNSGDSYLYFQMAFLHCVLLLFPLSINFFVFKHSFLFYFI